MFDRLRPYFQRQPRRAPSQAPPAPASSAPPTTQLPQQSPPAPAPVAAPRPTPPAPGAPGPAGGLQSRREDLARRLAELQWDLGGLTYEMAIRDQFRPELLARQAAQLQRVDAELASVDRMLELQQAGAAGSCPACRALYTAGAVYCWQCGTSVTPQPAVIPTAPTPPAT